MSAARERKRHGRHYTPPALARFLATRLLAHVPPGDVLRVLDPACGDGELLLAVRREAAERLPGVRLELTGYDLDPAAVELARSRADDEIDWHSGDFLVAEAHLPDGAFDAIITNPPYVRTQQLGGATARLLSKKFGLAGRIDLTHPFVAVAPRLLTSGGVLGLLCANRFLTTRAGANIRAILRRELAPVELYDLGDTKLFEAAVLPAITIARRDVVVDECRYASAYQVDVPESAGGHDLFEALAQNYGSLVGHNGRTFVVEVGTLSTGDSFSAVAKPSADQPSTDRSPHGSPAGTSCRAAVPCHLPALLPGTITPGSVVPMVPSGSFTAGPVVSAVPSGTSTPGPAIPAVPPDTSTPESLVPVVPPAALVPAHGEPASCPHLCKPANGAAAAVQISTDRRHLNSGGGLGDSAVAEIPSAAQGAGVWRMSRPALEEWLVGVEAGTWKTFGEVARIRVGIKTTADRVFISDRWRQVDPCPEPELLFDLITHHDLEPWRIARARDTRVLYPYDTTQSRRIPVDLREFPRAATYLRRHRALLAGRKYVIEGGREWFEIWVPQRPHLWQVPKLVFPDISVRPRFAFDRSGAVVNGDCYWMSLADIGAERIAYLLMGVANSGLGLRFYDAVCGNRLYSGRRRWITQYVSRLPVPDPGSRASSDIIGLVGEFVDGRPLDAEAQRTLDERVDFAFAG
ncbi:Eco57I restriction-modification methylase domain-containing protein [Nocardia goodfellowii]|uniref:site-specific DNA-methyltransferase (adenine-specific) n=1 Tax=Nocardia goodfellowii TaxID=882446 RepID=A0ABS4QQE3_9NOCA|nr:N-6 DNA methylase [Nocardia goodfellowii]MBP2193920.1 SAM-dependent methyltransferase [Nocardia goodfellowii]